MWGILIIGKPRGLDDMYRGLASLIIAWSGGIRCNMVVNGEIPIISDKHFDHVGLEVEIPLDLRKLIRGSTPCIIVEDSRSKKRLLRRENELYHIDIPKAFVYITPRMERNFMLSLTKINNSMYRMEVNV